MQTFSIRQDVIQRLWGEKKLFFQVFAPFCSKLLIC